MLFFKNRTNLANMDRLSICSSDVLRGGGGLLVMEVFALKKCW